MSRNRGVNALTISSTLPAFSRPRPTANIPKMRTRTLPSSELHASSASMQRATRIAPTAKMAATAIGMTFSAEKSTTPASAARVRGARSKTEEHTSELQSLMRDSYADFCSKTKIQNQHNDTVHQTDANRITVKITTEPPLHIAQYDLYSG